MKTERSKRMQALETADDRTWIAAVGEALYGERWQRPLAAALGLTGGYMSRLMADGKGRLEVSDALRTRVGRFAGEELPRRSEAYRHQAEVLAGVQARFLGTSK